MNPAPLYLLAPFVLFLVTMLLYRISPLRAFAAGGVVVVEDGGLDRVHDASRSATSSSSKRCTVATPR